MSTPPRVFIKDPHTFAAIRTTNQYQQRFTPNEDTSNRVLYHAGYESKRNNIDLNMILTTPYQICLIGSTKSAKSDIPKFFQNLNSIVARDFNASQGQSGYFWRDKSYGYIPQLGTEDLIETIANFATKPVRDGLVDDPTDWLGLSLRPTTTDSLEVEATKPDFCGNRSPKPDTLKIEFLHCEILRQEGVSLEEFLQRTEARITLKTAEYIAARALQNPELAPEPLTQEDQLAIDPLSYAGPIPQFTTASEAAHAEYQATSEVHLIHEQRVMAFRRAYRQAFEAWQEATDKNSVNFPIGTYKMRVIHGLTCTANYLLE